MSWLRRNASNIQSLSAVMAGLAAVGALAGLSLQLEAVDNRSRDQSARAAYRAHLTLAVAHPSYASPDDTCDLLNSVEGISYTAFVDHLLYSAEQMMSVEDGWDDTFVAALRPHAAYLCRDDAPKGVSPELRALLQRFRAGACQSTPSCLPPA